MASPRPRPPSRPSPRTRFLAGTVVLVALAALALRLDVGARPGGPDASDASVGGADAVAEGGDVLTGVSLDWATDSLAAYAERLGRTPAVVVTFAEVPLREEDLAAVQGVVDQAGAAGSSVLLTLEPNAGLAAVDEAATADLVRRLRAWNDGGVEVFLRYAHEMNGSWYPWGQQPEAYVASFRQVAAAVHDGAPGTQMMWAPSYAGGYPFLGGGYHADPAAPGVLDTDGDGVLTERDDGYAPFYPGDDAVDWVGMSLYHWGEDYPWGENEVPAPDKLVDQLGGTYVSTTRDERVVPDFHGEYGVARGKPVAVTETAALYVPGAGGAPEAEVKAAWWDQVWDPALAERLPALGMVAWFEWAKTEPEVGGQVDWRATADPGLAQAYAAALDRSGRARAEMTLADSRDDACGASR
ncbi:hypothetical protein GCM10009562_38550 [Nocardioides aquaticus]